MAADFPGLFKAKHRRGAGKLRHYSRGFGYLAVTSVYFMFSKVAEFRQFHRELDSLTPKATYPVKTELHEGITPEQLLSTPAFALQDYQLYQLGLARKLGFRDGDESGEVTHSSLALRDVEKAEGDDAAKMWLLYGRQNPIYSRKSDAIKEAVFRSEGEGVPNPQVDNEKFYEFFDNSPFKVELSAVRLTGAEVKAIIARCNETICKAQACDMLHSNSYSASMSMLAEAAKMIAQRKTNSPEERNRDLAHIDQLMRSAAQDNCAQGVSNNSRVREALASARKIMLDHGVLEENPQHDQISAAQDKAPQTPKSHP